MDQYNDRYEDVPPSLGRHGTALVTLDDERTTLATVLVLQEMGLSVDIAVNREAALPWALHARYSVVVCGGRDLASTTEFAVRLRYGAPQTRVILYADPALNHDGLAELGVEVLDAPLNVNALVDCLRPARAA